MVKWLSVLILIVGVGCASQPQTGWDMTAYKCEDALKAHNADLDAWNAEYAAAYREVVRNYSELLPANDPERERFIKQHITTVRQKPYSFALADCDREIPTPASLTTGGRHTGLNCTTTSFGGTIYTNCN